MHFSITSLTSQDTIKHKNIHALLIYIKYDLILFSGFLKNTLPVGTIAHISMVRHQIVLSMLT